MEPILKPGQKIQLEWTDGLIEKCIFLGQERGFLIFEDETGRRGACAKGHAKISVVKSENE